MTATTHQDWCFVFEREELLEVHEQQRNQARI